jgi:hypothetical protein
VSFVEGSNYWPTTNLHLFRLCSNICKATIMCMNPSMTSECEHEVLLEYIHILAQRHVSARSTIGSVSCNLGEPEQAPNLVEHMMLEHLVPNVVTFLSVSKACGSIRKTPSNFLPH